MYPAWSPDGSRIAFDSERAAPQHTGADDLDSDIFVMRPDGSGLSNLTGTPDRSERFPDWSPDGRWIAVHSVRSDTSSLLVLDLAGDAYDTGVPGEFPAWRPVRDAP